MFDKSQHIRFRAKQQKDLRIGPEHQQSEDRGTPQPGWVKHDWKAAKRLNGAESEILKLTISRKKLMFFEQFGRLEEKVVLLDRPVRLHCRINFFEKKGTKKKTLAFLKSQEKWRNCVQGIQNYCQKNFQFQKSHPFWLSSK
eukprot:TRINITY_DN58573_c0_g1_i1.p1 TRINITY_DN58573_c0_g1~~TRINITY_DN58573_c0_g1_i1.p1  ORF type:complete len:142 (-),score=12.64 TRINITY_DN58573_c0_g1_i1:52-477(-)